MLRRGLKVLSGSRQEWGIVLLLFLFLEITVGSVERARWITPHPSLTLTLVLSMLTGWVLWKSRLPVPISHTAALVFGIAVTVWQASNLLPPGVASRVNDLAIALRSWWQAMGTAEPAEGTLHFAVFLTFLTYLIGYVSTWFLLKKQNAWVAIALGGIAILINLGNLPQEHDIAFFFFLLMALVLLGVTNLAKHYDQLKKVGASPPSGAVPFAASLLSFSLLAVSIAWFTPEVRAERLETLVSTKTLWTKNIEQYLNDFLASIPAKQPFLRSDAKKELLFGDFSFGWGDELQLVVISEQPSYWRTRTYDRYASSGWSSSEAPEHLHQQGIISPAAAEIAKRLEMTYTVIPKIKTDILPTGGEFVSASIPVSAQTLAPSSFSLDLFDPVPDGLLPPDVASLAQTLRDARRADGDLTLEEVARFLSEDLRLAEAEPSQAAQSEAGPTGESTLANRPLTVIEVTRKEPADSNVVAVTSPYPLRPDRRYTVTSSLSLATGEDLSATSGSYPRWVTDYYRQLPSTVPQRVGQLSATITRTARTPYAKATAIKNYLFRLDYRLEGDIPPRGADGVDHFLFVSKSGNCVQFASAMAVMLRSIDIPSRVAIGYHAGEWDGATGTTLLTAKERHAWTEVYFPGYGWVGFDATPGVATPRAIGGIAGIEEDLLIDEFEYDLLGGTGIDGGSGGAAETTSSWSAMTLLFAIGAIILAVFVLRSIFSLLFLGIKRLLRASSAPQVYRKMCFLASLAGLGPKPYQTPGEYGARLVSEFPSQADALDNIVESYIEGQYSARKELGRWERWKLQKSWQTLQPKLLKRLFGIKS